MLKYRVLVRGAEAGKGQILTNSGIQIDYDVPWKARAVAIRKARTGYGICSVIRVKEEILYSYKMKKEVYEDKCYIGSEETLITEEMEREISND